MMVVDMLSMSLASTALSGSVNTTPQIPHIINYSIFGQSFGELLVALEYAVAMIIAA
jgi:hypothetical protein